MVRLDGCVGCHAQLPRRFVEGVLASSKPLKVGPQGLDRVALGRIAGQWLHQPVPLAASHARRRASGHASG
jgi:hypothetical protein